MFRDFSTQWKKVFHSVENFLPGALRRRLADFGG
jgi:hypothetical protein